jgi:hypothetical protein
MDLHSPKFCGNCGSPLPASARFCEKCGKQAGADARPPQPLPAGGARGRGKGWWVCGSLILIAAIGVFCLAITGLLVWTETIPLPAFLNFNQEPEVLVIPTLVISPSPTTEAAISETPAPAGTEEAAATTDSMNEPPPDFVYKGVSLSFDDSLARNLQGSSIPAVSDPENTSPWELLPEYINLDMVGYPLKDTFHQPRIMVFPLEDYYNINDSSRETAESLKELLKKKQASPDKAIPFLPQWNAAQIFHAAVKFVDFKNGSGVRFLTQYGQDISPINNHAIFYCYQGITSDGKYYISAVFPVFDPVLPMTSSEIPGGDYQAFADGFPQYLEENVKKMEEQQDLIFFPDLNTLDEMMASIEIKPQ